jgi:peptide-methionine (R)-S-oxide reductase
MTISKSEEQWRQELHPDQYRVLREKATEAPFSGEYDAVFEKGMYACGACGTTLFASDTKFDAHCGWPSFYDAIPGSVVLTADDSLGMSRTEVTCANCGSHLGHVFDGEGFDTPTDKRYCINSLSLKFNAKSHEI